MGVAVVADAVVLVNIFVVLLLSMSLVWLLLLIAFLQLLVMWFLALAGWFVRVACIRTFCVACALRCLSVFALPVHYAACTRCLQQR